MNYPKEIRQIHEEIQEKIFLMLPEKWSKLCLYASVKEHFNKLETGEMFFYYFPKGLLRKNPINVYEVPTRFSIDEEQYFRLADDLYNSIKKLRKKQIENKEKQWSEITLVIEDLKYKAIYSYEDLSKEQTSNKRIIWTYRYLKYPYESYNKREREIIDKYRKQGEIKEKTFELPIYTKEINKNLHNIGNLESKLKFVTEDTIKEIEFKNTHIPKSQILN